ncbi:MAG: Glutamate racemase [Paracidovorax wautersii]|uniref:Glutamate racemase n=1 Tax=Paracidovorax wautersii TaxID=1177982 RepID=A0A7V8FQ39_9BURK|nr:MAG: Glutamate racemase [Paracidovorax wautersii]
MALSSAFPLASPAARQPIGVFDSGIGGLSILQALRAELPHEDFVYLADSGHAPYGERGDDFVIARSLAITDYLVRTHGIKALVVACNTATAAAIVALRERHPTLGFIGVEPALKPAALLSRTKRIGVVATRGTLASGKFLRLRDTLAAQADFVLQPCPGLALALEQSVTIAADDPPAQQQSQQHIAHLVAHNLAEMGSFGTADGQIDTLVLGCTHYPFARDAFLASAGPAVQLLETGEPVARQTRRLLEAAHLLRQPSPDLAGTLTLLTTGGPQALQQAAATWLRLPQAQATGLDIAA